MISFPFSLAGKRVTLMGLGSHGGGLGAARYLAAHGARVTVTDLATEEKLAATLAALKGVPIERWRLGGHDEQDFCETDLVVANPAVPPGNRYLKVAAEGGVPITTEIEMFLNACPLPVIGVTGTVGKSTVCALIAASIRAAGRRVWLGGNFGDSLLMNLTEMSRDERTVANSNAPDGVFGTKGTVVLELSSFQLERLRQSPRMPGTVVVLNCSPNHLDWHGSFAAYQEAKRQLIVRQPANGTCILNTRDAVVGNWRSLARGRMVEPCWELAAEIIRNSSVGNFAMGGADASAIVGEHFRANVACAAAAAMEAGCDEDAVRCAIAEFRPLPHRIELVAEIDGRRFVNDSKATTPAASMAAVRATGPATWLIAGGVAKGVEFSGWAREVAAGVLGVALIGESAQEMERELTHVGPRVKYQLTNLAGAVEWCWSLSQPGDTILLSPACASFDQFADFAARGEAFVTIVRELQTRVED